MSTIDMGKYVDEYKAPISVIFLEAMHALQENNTDLDSVFGMEEKDDSEESETSN